MAEEHIVRAILDTSKFTEGRSNIDRDVTAIAGTFDRLNGLVSKLTSAFALLGVGLSVNKIIEVNTTFEKLGAQLETVTGSAASAKVAFDALTQFAAKTPFQLAEVTEAFTQLKARGLDPSLESLQGYANIASGFGRSIGDAIRAVGAATLGETEPLKSFGIQAVQAGDKMIFTFQGVQTQVAKTAEEIEKYLVGIGKNQFAGAVERQLLTLGGAFSNLEDILQTTIYAFGEAGFNNALKRVVLGTTDALTATKGFAAALGQLTGGAINSAIDAMHKYSAELEAVALGIGVVVAGFAALKVASGVVSALAAVVSVLAAPVAAAAAAFAAIVATVYYFRDATLDLGGGPIKVLEIVDAAFDNIVRDIKSAVEWAKNFGTAVADGFQSGIDRLKEMAAAIARIYNSTLQFLNILPQDGAGRGGGGGNNPRAGRARQSPAGGLVGGEEGSASGFGATITADALAARARRQEIERQEAADAREEARDRYLNRTKDPFQRADLTAASPQAVQVADALRKQLVSADLTGSAQGIASSVVQSGIALSGDQVRAFAKGGATPIVDSNGGGLKQGELDVLNQIRERQIKLTQAALDLENKLRDATVKAQNDNVAAYGKGTRAIEEADAMQQALEANARDGRDVQKEYAKQLEVADASRAVQAAASLRDAQLNVEAQQRLANAAKEGGAAFADMALQNEALAAAARNSKVNVEELLKTLREAKALAAEATFKNQAEAMREQAEAAQKVIIRVNQTTLAYEAYNRELLVVQETQRLVALGGVTKERAREMAEATVDAQDGLKKIEQANEQLRKQTEANDWTLGARRGLEQYRDTALNMSRTVENAVVNTFQSMEDALVKFVKTGKLDFKSLADSIITDLIRIQVRSAITSAIGGAGGGGGLFGSILSLGLSLFGGGGIGVNNAAALGDGAALAGVGGDFIIPGTFARGGVFAGGNVIPFARGDVFNQPRTFALANGGVGMLGEAGPEAIMPLTRDAGGRLGVRSAGAAPANDGGTTIINIDARGAQVGVHRQIMDAINQAEPGIRKRAVGQAVQAVGAEADRGGRYAKTIGRRS